MFLLRFFAGVGVLGCCVGVAVLGFASMWGRIMPQSGVLALQNNRDAFTYLLDVDSGVLLNLGDITDARRTFSRDGKRELRVVVDATQAQMTAFYVLPSFSARTQSPRLMVRNEQASTIPEWSPNGEQLAFSMRSATNPIDQLFLFDIATNQLTQLTDSPVIQYAPTWSPNGTQLVYQTWQNDNWDLAIFDLATNTSHALTITPMNESDPRWSPDGTRILFMTDELATPDLFTIQPDGDNRQALITGRYIESSGRWSLDGQFVAFLSLRAGGVTQIFLYDVQTQSIRQITFGGGAFQPTWWR
jgi:TolB protein